MKGKIYYRKDVGAWEWVCEHGVGHYFYGGVHGCDGCCSKLTDMDYLEIHKAIQVKIRELNLGDKNE